MVIVGAGQAGVSLAARLRRDGFTDVALIDPRQTHRYRPLLSYVGGGQATLADLERPQAEVIPSGVTCYRDEVARVDPIARRVETAGGRRISAADLVLCPGVTPDWDDVLGSHRAVHSGHGSSNYVDERAPYTWQLVAGFTAGNAVFAVAAGPVPCAGAALKPLFLAADHWRRAGVLGKMTVTLIVPWPTIFGIAVVDDELMEVARRLGITVLTGTRVRRIDTEARTLELDQSGTASRLPYDLVHFVPRHRPPSWLAAGGLGRLLGETTSTGGPADDSAMDAHVAGMIDVDPATLAHRRHPSVWGSRRRRGRHCLQIGWRAAQAGGGGGRQHHASPVPASTGDLRRLLHLTHHGGPGPTGAGRVRPDRSDHTERPADRPRQAPPPDVGVRPLSAAPAVLALHLEGPRLPLAPSGLWESRHVVGDSEGTSSSGSSGPQVEPRAGLVAEMRPRGV